MKLVIKGREEWEMEKVLKFLIRYRYGYRCRAERGLYNEQRWAVWV